jgi:hypothetical protein
MAELGETLDRSSFGIIVVTRTNQNSQWINFEAGALSKKVGDPAVSVIPLLVDFDSPTDLTGPLAQFQAMVYGREQLLPMMLVIAGRAGVSQRAVQHRFETHWTTFDDQVQQALKNYPAEAGVPERGKEDKTDEMLAILRRLQSDQRAVPVTRMLRSRPGHFNIKDPAGGTTKVHAVEWAKSGDKFFFRNEAGALTGDIWSTELVDSISWVDEGGEEGPILWSKHGGGLG